MLHEYEKCHFRFYQSGIILIRNCRIELHMMCNKIDQIFLAFLLLIPYTNFKVTVIYLLLVISFLPL